MLLNILSLQMCLIRPSTCEKGLSMAFWIYVTQENEQGYIISSGGQSPSTTGLAIYIYEVISL